MTQKLCGDVIFRYKNSAHISIDDRIDNSGKKLNSRNCWVRLTRQIPSDELARIYADTPSKNKGLSSKDARPVIGKILINHFKGLPDEDVIPKIQENPYLKYFINLNEFTKNFAMNKKFRSIPW